MECVVVACAVARIGAPVFPRWRGISPECRSMLPQFTSAAAGSVIMAGSHLIDQSLAAMLSSGSVSVLNYGTRLVSVALSVGPAALNTAAFPRLAALAASGKTQEVHSAVRRYALLSLSITVPVSALLMFVSLPMVEFAFRHGAFTNADAHMVAKVQAFSLARIPITVLLSLLVTLVASLKRNHMLFAMAAICLASNVAISAALMHTLGVSGLALSTAFVHLVGVAYLSHALRSRSSSAANFSTSSR